MCVVQIWLYYYNLHCVSRFDLYDEYIILNFNNWDTKRIDSNNQRSEYDNIIKRLKKNIIHNDSEL